MSVHPPIPSDDDDDDDDDDDARYARKTRLAAGAAFAWMFVCGALWVESGAKNYPDRFFESVNLGLVAGLPALVLALVIFFSGAARLVKRRKASSTALFLAATTVVTGLAMHLFLWSLWLGRAYPSYFAHGRRLHRRRTILAPRAAEGAGWLDVAAPDVIDAPRGARAGLAAQWRENAAKEHASIAAFAQLTLDLMTVGAPARLVAASHRASLDEVRHAELGYAVARALDGREQSPAPFPEAHTRRALSPRREVALAAIAVDALADGALNEGIASRLLARLAATSASPELGEVLRAMATDEARHAKDSWDVVVWCLEEGGELVRRALERAAGTMPLHLGSPLPPEARDGAGLAWGVQSVALEVTEYARVRRSALRRLEVLVGQAPAARSAA